MRGYNDDLVMSLSIGLWVRDTALRLRTEGVLLQKTAMNNVGTTQAVYQPSDARDNGSRSWEMNLGKEKEDLTWLINK